MGNNNHNNILELDRLLVLNLLYLGLVWADVRLLSINSMHKVRWLL